MNIVNPSLPTGKKFYPVPEQYQTTFEMVLNRQSHKEWNTVQERLKNCHLHYHRWGMHGHFHRFVMPEGTDLYPIVTTSAAGLHMLGDEFSKYVDHKKANYASNTRIGVFHMPLVDQYAIKLQWDPVRKGIIVHNHPYEGELVSNKPMVINKQLKNIITEKVNELALEVLIGADIEDLEVKNPWYYDNKAQKGAEITELIPKILDGTYETKELSQLSVLLGIYKVKNAGTGYMYKYIVDTDNKADGAFDITAATRTNLIYRLGGYNLPENYTEWFDG